MPPGRFLRISSSRWDNCQSRGPSMKSRDKGSCLFGSTFSGGFATNPYMLENFPRYPLTFGPTHIEKLERLSTHLGGQVELYAKREDCNSGLAFGGNKL